MSRRAEERRGLGDQPPTTVELASAADAAAPRFLLEIAKGGVRIHVLPPQGTAILGRAPECQIVLDYPVISRQHTRLDVGPTCTITDLGSRNGTRFQGQRLRAGETRKLGPGDSFRVGPISLLLLPPGVQPSSVAT